MATAVINHVDEKLGQHRHQRRTDATHLAEHLASGPQMAQCSSADVSNALRSGEAETGFLWRKRCHQFNVGTDVSNTAGKDRHAPTFTRPTCSRKSDQSLEVLNGLMTNPFQLDC
jgi:hypothetical protein